MDIRAWLHDLGTTWWPAVATLLLSISAIVAVKAYTQWRRASQAAPPGLVMQLSMLFLVSGAVVAMIVALPIGDTVRGQLLGLLGILLTAAVALASTTFVGNAMAGMMLRAIRHIRPGDFLRVGDQFGRVSEQGFLHTEIQTEDRDLTTLPNLYLVTNPVTVIHSSGTILSAQVSLGYDVPRSKVEDSLHRAAAAAGLVEPFVQIIDLGDFSVTYRAAGMLENVKHLVTSRSRLRACMLDTLHSDGIEIVSPTFMNQRVFSEGRQFRPRGPGLRVSQPSVGDVPDARIFDKAEAAQERAALEAERKQAHQALVQAKKELDDGTGDEADELQNEIAQLESRLEELGRVLSKPSAGVSDREG